MPATIHAIPPPDTKKRGPNTPQGKSKVANNATKHGLTAKTIVLANESKAAFQILLESLAEEWNPAGDTEFLLIEEMAAAAWRQRRAWAIESSHFDLAMVKNEPAIQEQFDSIDHETRTALAHKSLIEEGRALANIQRHEERLSRQYDRTLRRLMVLQQQRQANEAAKKTHENNILQNNLSTLAPQPKQPAPPTRSVPENPALTGETKEKIECPGPSSQPPNHSSAPESN